MDGAQGGGGIHKKGRGWALSVQGPRGVRGLGRGATVAGRGREGGCGCGQPPRNGSGRREATAGLWNWTGNRQGVSRVGVRLAAGIKKKNKKNEVFLADPGRDALHHGGSDDLQPESRAPILGHRT